jgi:ABC-type Mn2+/Zn2+ transport system permease subunit
VAIAVTTLFGLGALLALAPSSPPGIQELLFGDVLGVSDTDLVLAAAAAAVALGALRLLHGQLLAVGFDRGSAPALGASPALAETALLVLLALAVLVGVQGLGNLLVVAAIVAPAATARQICSRMLPMMAVAVATAAVGGAIGLYVSYYAGTAAGASVAAALVVIYLLAALASSVGQRGSEVYQ